MSHTTSGKDQDTWAHLDEQRRLHQNPGFQTASQHIATSHDPFPTFTDNEASSAFDFSHLTPDQSTDEPFHTPELDDLLWQVNQTEASGANTRVESYTSNDIFMNGASSLQPDAPNTVHHNLPSPQLTNTSTPEASGHSKKSSRGTAFLASPMTSPQQSKRRLASDDIDMSYGSTLNVRDSNLADLRTASPMIQVSKYHRGDSPARAEYEGFGLNKKRSASNLSTSEVNSQQEEDTSHLMPIQNTFEEEWDDQVPERLGVAPTARDEEEIPSIEDMQHQKEHEDTIHEVESWLERTSIDPNAAARRTAKLKTRSDLLRSRSTGTKVRPALERGFNDRHVPGPGRLVDEQSDYYYSDHPSEASSVENYPETVEPELPPRKPSVEFAPDEVEPLPTQFFRRGPWQDPPRAQAPTISERWQPDSSNAAIQRFQQRAKNFETASRAATWGTGRLSRRLSDGEIDSIFGDGKTTRHLSLSKRTRERGTIFMHEMRTKAKESILKRSNSHQKRQFQHAQDLEKVQSPDMIEERSSTDSINHTAIHPTQSHHSLTRAKSPPHTTSQAVMAAASNLAAVGAGSNRLSVDQHRHHENFITKAIKRVRSRSDVNKSPKTSTSTGLSGLLSQQGGMPVPIVSHHSHENLSVAPMPEVQPVQPVPAEAPVYPQDEITIKMDLTPHATTNIIPNFDGFKTQIRELNPRLEPYLVERIAHDQVKRYKRLVKSKVDHTIAMAEQRCASGNFCEAFGGEAEILVARGSFRDAPASSGQFRVAAAADSDPDDSNFDGVVSAALFPDGIPLPPAKRLPAKFECYLCFQVKTFQKPSDWTKHVHEDVQPFTCTFPQCPDPKPFKRKADWVRHENERHRHLEWWQCNIQECQHKCYRKDNFVQHLVREHKRKEPKIKGRVNTNTKGKSRNVINTFNQEERDFWNLVDSCRKDGATDARSEPCKFCGNVCASWKKLSVHVGKHMEQIAMPVLGLARQRNVNKDTIISPVEPLPSRTHGFSGIDRSITGEVNNTMNVASPYTQSGASNYQSSSAGQSPAIINHHLQPSDVMATQQMYMDRSYAQNVMHQGTLSTLAHDIPGTFAPAPDQQNMYNYNTVAFGNNSTYPGMFPQTQMQYQQEMPNTQAMAPNSYLVMENNYEAPQQYFSSPEIEQQSFVGGYHGDPMHGNTMMDATSIMQGHMTTPATTQSMSNEYVYPPSHQQSHPHPHPHAGTGGQYYQS